MPGTEPGGAACESGAPHRTAGAAPGHRRHLHGSTSSLITALTHPMAAQFRTWWTILRISLEERLVYRAHFAPATLMRFLPIITQIFLWTAIFSATTREDIVGYSKRDMIAYYLLVMIVRAFSSMPNLASGIAFQVREGEIKKFLIQPVDLIGFLLLTRVAHKLVYYLIAIGPFALVFYLCRGYFSLPVGPNVGAFIACLIFAFLIGFFLEATIGMISFWWLEVSSLLFIYMLFNFILSGHMFTLDLLPGPWRIVVDLLPFQYLAYFPAAVMLGKIQGEALAHGLWIQLVWVVFLMLICRLAYHAGVRRYSGFGG